MILIEKKRFVSNQNLAENDSDFQSFLMKIGIDPHKNTLEISSGRLIIIDPVYLADIYNENGEKELYLKKNGILLNDLGGDVGGPILRTREGGIMMLLVFDRVYSDGHPVFSPESSAFTRHEDEDILLEEIGCDSGSYIFLDFNNFFCELFKNELVENASNYALVDIKNGIFHIGYEQWEINEENPFIAWRRNLVAFPIE